MSGDHPYNGPIGEAPLIGEKNLGQVADDLLTYKAAVKEIMPKLAAAGGAIAHVTFVFYPDTSFNRVVVGNITPIMLAAALTNLSVTVQGGVQQLMATIEQMANAQKAAFAKGRGIIKAH